MAVLDIALVVGTRPEVIKMAPVARALDDADWCRPRIVTTAQHREMLDQALSSFGLHADVDLDLMKPGATLAELTGRALAGLDAVFEDLSPARVVAQGDTTTVLAAALAAFYRRIPFAHVEAGLRTHTIDTPFPEEANRQLVTRLADLHFAPTPRAAADLRGEGVPADAIVVTGNTAVDALLWADERANPEAFRPTGDRRLLLVTVHRRESFGAPLARICAALRQLADRSDVEVLLPVHPNPSVREPVHRTLGDHPAIRLVDPLAHLDLVAALRACSLVLTDSGGIQEEAPSFDKPVLVLRDQTERPEAVEAGTAVLVGTDRERIVRTASLLLDDPERYAAMTGRGNPFGDGKAAERIVAALRARHGV